MTYYESITGGVGNEKFFGHEGGVSLEEVKTFLFRRSKKTTEIHGDKHT